MNAPIGNPHRYDDMSGLEHPISKTHPPMARGKRAAQFAAFDALTGFGEAICEAGRETEEKLELSEDMIDMINARLAVIEQHIKEQPCISTTYFLPDNRSRRPSHNGPRQCEDARRDRTCYNHDRQDKNSHRGRAIYRGGFVLIRILLYGGNIDG